MTVSVYCDLNMDFTSALARLKGVEIQITGPSVSKERLMLSRSLNIYILRAGKYWMILE